MKATPLAPEQLPADLIAIPQWVAWRYDERDGKVTKVPVSARTGRLALTNAPSTWATFEEVLPFARARGHGIGFVFAPADPFVGIDLDACVEGDHIAPWAWAIITTLNSYTEVSPSGGGVHTFVRAALPPGGKRKGPVELYDRLRFFTVTGQRLADVSPAVEERSAEVAALHGTLFPPPPPAATSAPAPLHNWDDAEVVRRAMSAANGRKFAHLWLGQGDDYTSASEGDAALCALLAFWTGPDAGRLDALFRQSARMRPKWERASYRDRTIALALQRVAYYTPRAGGRDGIPLFGTRRA